MRLVTSGLVVLALTACTGTFKTDQQFQSYIDALRLSSLSVVNASKALVTKGFTCQSSKERSINCARLRGNQTQSVDLSPTPSNPDTCIVVISLVWVFA